MINADLSGIGNYIGAVEGFISAVQDPRVQDDFLGNIMNKTREAFYVQSLSAARTGQARIKHAYEWGDNQGEMSSVRLYRLTKHGSGGSRFMSYHFLPSTKFVPLPDASKYGFAATSKRGNGLSRHIFTMKALVMETKDQVTIKPVKAKALFIPTTSNKKGFVMSTSAVKINPGGPAATGGFASWWEEWFATSAHKIAVSETKKAEEVIATTGRKVIRHVAGTRIGGKAVGGQFTSGIGVSYGYINAAKQNAELEAKNIFKRVWEDEDEMGDEE